MPALNYFRRRMSPNASRPGRAGDVGSVVENVVIAREGRAGAESREIDFLNECVGVSKVNGTWVTNQIRGDSSRKVIVLSSVLDQKRFNSVAKNISAFVAIFCAISAD